MRVASFMVSSRGECLNSSPSGYRVPRVPTRHALSQRWVAAIRDCRFAAAGERVYRSYGRRDGGPAGPTPNQETGHVRAVAVFTGDDPRYRAAQPHRGAADAPILRGEGISHRLASDE